MAIFSNLAYKIPLIAVAIYCIRLYTRGGVCESDAKLTGKVVIITGANTGIGKMNALDHVQRGARVILACRSMERGEQAAADILNITGAPKSQLKVMKLNLSSLKSIRQFAEDFKKHETRLDILTNNAGVMWIPYSTTEDGFETHFGVNHLGHFLLTNLLLDMLKKSAPSRIITVSSMGYAFATIDFENLMGEKSYSRILAYSGSKLANILFTKELAKRLEGTGVTANANHPGFVVSDLWRHVGIFYDYMEPFFLVLFWPFQKDTMDGAQTQICLAVDPELANTSGIYYSDCREKSVMAKAEDMEVAARLWEVSAELVGLKPEESA